MAISDIHFLNSIIRHKDGLVDNEHQAMVKIAGENNSHWFYSDDIFKNFA